MLSLVAAISFSAASFPPVPQSAGFQRGNSFELDPLISDGAGGTWGPSDREADHATIAINEDKDVLVTYHTDRTDLDSMLASGLKQVEAAFFEYDPQNDAWDLKTTTLLGQTIHDPLAIQAQSYMKCERPDVVAVGSRFFVVWTRRYDRTTQTASGTNLNEEPAVTECAWLEWDAQSQVLNVHDSGTSGQGYILDMDVPGTSNLWVRECGGAADAVVLRNDTANGTSTVGVVYAHQTDFGDDPGGNDGTRLHDLRVATCSIDSSNVISHNDYGHTPLRSDVKFHGSIASGPAALILPDAAESVNVLDPNDPMRMIVAIEEQLGTNQGRIRVGLFEESSGSWSLQSSKTFGSASSNLVRRRPNVSTYPPTANGKERALIAFGKDLSGGDRDVVFEEWDFTVGAGPVAWPLGHEWNNTSARDSHPVPLYGATGTGVFFRRLYLDHDIQTDPSITSKLQEYDVDSDGTRILSDHEWLGRPATSYLYDASATEPHYAALSWEERATATSPTRIWVTVLDD